MALKVMAAYPEESPERQSIVSLCFGNTVVENKQQQNREQTVKGLLLCEWPLHLDAKMGHSQARPTVGAMPPSPRTVCALRLAEPSHRFCCHYQHFSYPERAMSYSPPYSPSLFKRPERRASGASVVAIDNKIEQAMDLVKNHLMYAVREEVEVLKEQIKELAEKNNQLERENYLLKNLASPEQLEKFQSRIPTDMLLPLDNVSSQVTPDQHQPCSLSTGSAV
ncbi:TSC22 domain family protein 3 isoform X1 [Etheostoma cragini]|uniref:TSC22 domain family protein 3 isoform X1 n=1 Tax=Etheostoma cragini TaxID=417921 RepID=UPI00155E47EB|nr:TSC22 domain family protein 3 isoform X1 [Etheostoma cragini]